jgi:hypothetical protein
MSLDVQLEMLVDGHNHRGVKCAKGELITTDPTRAERLIASGKAKKVGVVEAEAEEVSEVEADEAEVEDLAEEPDGDDDED